MSHEASPAYWCDRRIVVTLAGPAGATTVHLDRPYARVGSHPGCDVVVLESHRPRRIVYLHATAAGLYCLFLETLGADAAGSGRWLQPEEELTIGHYRLSARLDGENSADSSEVDLLKWGRTPAPWPLLTVWKNGRLIGRRRLHARLNVIGRRQQTALQLQGDKVSAFHCVLYTQHQRLWCIDLMSSNGTLLDSNPIACAPLPLGTSTTIGEFDVLYHRLSSRKKDATATGADKQGSSVSSGPENSVRSVEPEPPASSSDAAAMTIESAATVDSSLSRKPGDSQGNAHWELQLAEQAKTFESERTQCNERLTELSAEVSRLQTQSLELNHQLQSQITQGRENTERYERLAVQTTEREIACEDARRQMEVARSAADAEHGTLREQWQTKLDELKSQLRQNLLESDARHEQLRQQYVLAVSQVATLRDDLIKGQAARQQESAAAQKALSQLQAEHAELLQQLERGRIAMIEAARVGRERTLQLEGDLARSRSLALQRQEQIENEAKSLAERTEATHQAERQLWEATANSADARARELEDDLASAKHIAEAERETANLRLAETKSLHQAALDRAQAAHNGAMGQCSAYEERIRQLEDELAKVQLHAAVPEQRSLHHEASAIDSHAATLLPGLDPAVAEGERKIMTDTAEIAPARRDSRVGRTRPKRDELPDFVGDRLVELDGQRRRQILYWSAGGIGVAALVLLIIAIGMML